MLLRNNLTFVHTWRVVIVLEVYNDALEYIRMYIYTLKSQIANVSYMKHLQFDLLVWGSLMLAPINAWPSLL